MILRSRRVWGPHRCWPPQPKSLNSALFIYSYIYLYIYIRREANHPTLLSVPIFLPCVRLTTFCTLSEVKTILHLQRGLNLHFLRGCNVTSSMTSFGADPSFYIYWQLLEVTLGTAARGYSWDNLWRLLLGQRGIWRLLFHILYCATIEMDSLKKITPSCQDFRAWYRQKPGFALPKSRYFIAKGGVWAMSNRE